MRRLAARAGLDADARNAAEGLFPFDHGDRVLDLRVGCIPTRLGLLVNVRLPEASGRPSSLAELGLPRDVDESLRQALRRPNGVVVVSGAALSGRTTTLHAALQELATPDRTLASVEDPRRRPRPRSRAGRSRRRRRRHLRPRPPRGLPRRRGRRARGRPPGRGDGGCRFPERSRGPCRAGCGRGAERGLRGRAPAGALRRATVVRDALVPRGPAPRAPHLHRLPRDVLRERRGDLGARASRRGIRQALARQGSRLRFLRRIRAPRLGGGLRGPPADRGDPHSSPRARRPRRSTTRRARPACRRSARRRSGSASTESRASAKSGSSRSADNGASCRAAGASAQA